MFTYTLSRSTADDDEAGYTSTSITDHDLINAAHMLAAAFNTMNRPMLNGFALGVVNTKAGTVQYDGKIEKIDRPEPAKSGVYEQTFTFEPSAGDADTILTLFDHGETPTFMAFGKFSAAETATDETTSAVAAETIAPKLNRKVLEDAYIELHRVKDALFDAGVEMIPADRGVKDLSHVIRARDAEIEELKQTLVELAPTRNAANEAARAEMIEYVKGAYAKLGRLDAAGERDDLQGRMRGMLDVLAKFLVVTGEADYDERHAVARRLVEQMQD